MRGLALVGVVLVVSTIAAADAAADKPSKSVRKGIALYDDLEYQQAAKSLRKALEKRTLSRDSKIAGYQYLGLALVALERENEARDAFRKLLEIDRRFVLPKTFNPKARELLEEVRRDLADDVTIEAVASPVPGRVGAPINLRITVSDKSGVVRSVLLHYRVGTKAFSSTQATRTGKDSFTATISGAFVATPTVSYYLQALAVGETTMASVGSAENPRTIKIEKAPDEGSSFFASPWLWVGVGVVAAGGAAAFFILRSDKPPQGSVIIDPMSPPATRSPFAPYRF